MKKRKYNKKKLSLITPKDAGPSLNQNKQQWKSQPEVDAAVDAVTSSMNKLPSDQPQMAVSQLQKEITLPQLPGFATMISVQGDLGLARPDDNSYNTYRIMRLDHTLALARQILLNSIMSIKLETSAEDDAPEGAKDFIEDWLKDRQFCIMKYLSEDNIDFGFACSEKIFKIENGKVIIDKLKKMIPELSWITIFGRTGAKTGVRQMWVYLPLDKVAIISGTITQIEGTQWYGRSLLKNAYRPWVEWNEAAEGLSKYNRRIAGAQYIVKYPIGQIPLPNGEILDASKIAEDLLHSLKSGEHVAVPSVVAYYFDKMNGNIPAGIAEYLDFQINILEDKTPRQPSFTEGLEYFDTLKVRALLTPERSLISAGKGHGSSKADSQTHADQAVGVADIVSKSTCDQLNEQVINQMLELNYGPSAINTVRINPLPMEPDKKALLADVYMQLLQKPQDIDVDMGALEDALEIPHNPDVISIEKPETPEITKEPLPLDTKLSLNDGINIVEKDAWRGKYSPLGS
jgi:hypothetical protein